MGRKGGGSDGVRRGRTGGGHRKEQGEMLWVCFMGRSDAGLLRVGGCLVLSVTGSEQDAL